MAVVEGSVQDELVIVRRAKGYRFWRAFWLAILILVTAGGGYLYGYFDSYTQMKVLKEENGYLKDGLRTSEKTIEDLSQRVAVLEKGGEVDRQAADGFRDTVKDLKDQVSVLEQEVAFYKGIMAPGSADKGLRISRIDLDAISANQYSYAVMMTQVVDNTNYVQGEVAVNVIGLRSGEQEVIALRDLDDNISELGIPFRFRYFQELKGILNLPDGFTPQQLQVVMQSRGQNSQRVEETRNWNSEGEA
ncbi:MAG: hypothetical protein CMH97_06760 [Oceanospirillaceae bacterium]|jgi:hypothetical protein|uniref:DUF6776 family protein n=1 Tax=unclassified Thalassolituus TaxID=2624967 RepID=UPI000C0D2042|nr:MULTISPECIES: DUF6776 family protein [unclassified Thalassolituus]MAE34939.1 hypothetical protein [Oceanospirillaceae bacterium]MBN57415.1 hypothetical protein [Oceanospirillaceae bacterium]MDQ4423392.1 hypothetical protein [Thalassolituus sp.]MDQ4425720.1 hypothetical protein [Thalassolituus sp.]|tara:strand:- start:463 stop:1203 length:741 start_codon:yes stop_codon:yes gene_type:complete